MNTYPQESVEALTHFREQVTAARRQAGYLQKELAAALGLDAETLSRKLHGRHHTFLTLQDVKQIIKTLVAWQSHYHAGRSARTAGAAMPLTRELFTRGVQQRTPLPP
jgi:transcriptional regulator with XRE-family HTH domain